MQEIFTVEEHKEHILPYGAETPVGKYAWTRGSQGMPLFEALRQANVERASLQEFDSAVLIRAGLHEAHKDDSKIHLDDSNLLQVVNTLWVARRSKDGWTVSYCRLPNSDDGVKLAKEGYHSSNEGKDLFLPLDDDVLCTMIDEAQNQGRDVPALDTKGIELDLKKDYAHHPHIIAAFGGKEHGQKVAAVNAAYLQDNNCDRGCSWQPNITDLEKILPKDDPHALTHAVVRAMGLGGDDCNRIYNIGAGKCDFNKKGRARWYAVRGSF